MDKKDEIISLIHQITDLQGKKKEVIKNQSYEEAAALRDDEKILLKKLDLESGVDDFYYKVYHSEKVLRHFEIMTNSMNELKRMGARLDEEIDTSLFDKMHIKLLKQRDEAYEAVLEIRKFMD
jgi:hypothetical protein